MQYVSGALMYVISHMKLKKKYNITDERVNLFQVTGSIRGFVNATLCSWQAIDEWVAAVGDNKFLGGDQPSRQDLEVTSRLR